MKVTRSAKTSDKARFEWQRITRTFARVLPGVLIAFLLIAVLSLLFRPDYMQRIAVGMEKRWGYSFRAYDRSLSDNLSVAVGNYLRGTLEGVPDIPELVIDVPFKEISKIYAKREEALERGILVQGDDAFVKGDIRFEGRTLPIKLRLKGDWNDHLMGRKWSFRIRIRGGEELFGMRRFSIQNPNTRGFQSELMFFEVMRLFGVMVPRYMFVSVTLNGDSIGLMALEEFFAKELLEHNQRREGVIVRFDESYAWEARDGISSEENGWGGSFDHYSNAPIDAIGSSRIAESPALSRQYAVAVGLLNGFVEGKLAASEVFDVPQLAAFIAVSDFFGSWHSIAWHNMRFYLNPVTMRLEPIPFDATLQDRFEGNESVINDEPILVRMLSDQVIWRAYLDVLEDLAARSRDGSMKKLLEATQARYLPVLQTEFRLLSTFPTDYLDPRLDALLARAKAVVDAGGENNNLYVTYENELDEYPVFAHLGLINTADSGQRLQIDNAIPREVQITAVEWVNETDGTRVSSIHKEILPLMLAARGIGSLATRTSLVLAPAPDPDKWVLEVSAGLAGRDWVRQFRPAVTHEALETMPVPDDDAESQADAHAFLNLDEKQKLFTVAAGSWDVLDSLIIPDGYSLLIQAGATLRFAPTATLVSHGPVRIAGTAAAPVVLEPLDAVWPGLVVMEAGALSVLEHVRVHDTAGVSVGSWSLTGGVNFYRSDVEISNSEFRDSHGEDALNIIHSAFNIRDSLIRGTASDAFDADFSTGTVEGSRFQEVGKAGGGDAVDISGSKIEVVRSEFSDISDKALSVGERSEMTVTDVTIDSAGTGAASKDGSILELSDSKISNVSFAALTAYIKKPEYGTAEIIARNISIAGAEEPVLVQVGSRISVDGVDAEARDVDVDALYETIMRKGLR